MLQVRADGDEERIRHLQELNQKKGDLIRQMEAIDQRFGLEYADGDALRAKAAELEAAAEQYDELSDLAAEIDEAMEEIFAESDDINPSDYPNY